MLLLRVAPFIVGGPSSLFPPLFVANERTSELKSHCKFVGPLID